MSNGGQGSTAAAGEECTPVRKLKSATRTSDNEIPQGSFPVGVTTYTEIFTHEELNAIEAMADAVQEMAHNNDLPEECFHETIGRGGNLKRTKYFFGARYMWTRDQMSDPNSKRAGGVRLDVPACPKWMEVIGTARDIMIWCITARCLFPVSFQFGMGG